MEGEMFVVHVSWFIVWRLSDRRELNPDERSDIGIGGYSL